MPKLGNPNPNWKPGVSGNPSGRPKGLLTKDKVSIILAKLTNMTMPELDWIILDGKTPVIEKIIAQILRKAFDTGDASRLEFLLSRAIGKVTDVKEVHNINTEAHQALDQEPKENVLKLLADMRGPKAQQGK